MGILDFAAALAAGVLTGLGTGNGGLFILYLMYAARLGAEDARGVNLAFFVAASAASLLINIIKKRVAVRRAVVLAAFGTAASFLGSRVSELIGNAVITAVFGVFFILSGIYALFGNKISEKISFKNIRSAIDRMISK